MAAGDITLIEDVSTIEVDSTERTATKVPQNIRGWLVNAGSTTVFINATGGTVATTDTQARSIISIPAGATIPLPKNHPKFTYKVASGTSILYWVPDVR